MALRNNSEAWQEELEERLVWDITLVDSISMKLGDGSAVSLQCYLR